MINPFVFVDASNHQTRQEAPGSSQTDTPVGDSGQTIRGLRNAVSRFDKMPPMDAETKEMLKSWVKVFLSSSFALYAAGSTDILDIVNAGLIAVLPLVWTWIDPKDTRFGRTKK